MATTRTINELIRDGLRVNSSKYTDSDVEDWICRSLEFLNVKTDREDTIADESNATTNDPVYDTLIAKFSLWQIHVELYHETRGTGANEGDGVFQHVSSIFRREFFDWFMACYPGLVEIKGGKPVFADVAYADPWVGIADNRYDADEAVRFDAPE